MVPSTRATLEVFTIPVVLFRSNFPTTHVSVVPVSPFPHYSPILFRIQLEVLIPSLLAPPIGIHSFSAPIQL